MSLLVRATVALCLTTALAGAATTLTVVKPGSSVSSSILEAMQQESERLVAPADYRFSWRTSTGAGDAFEQLVVLKLRGTCALRPMAADMRHHDDAASLGSTAVSDGRVLPFVQVDCDRVWKAVAPLLAPMPERARETMFGRALGRVLAHELYHVLAQTRGHAGEGVSKPCFRAADLLNARFQFDKASLARMRPAVASPVLLASAEAADGDAEGSADDGGR